MNLDKAQNILRVNSFGKTRLTKTKTNLLTLISNVKYFTVSELMAKADELDVKISLPTVYNNIDLFRRLSLIREVKVVKNKYRTGGNGLVTLYKSNINHQ